MQVRRSLLSAFFLHHPRGILWTLGWQVASVAGAKVSWRCPSTRCPATAAKPSSHQCRKAVLCCDIKMHSMQCIPLVRCLGVIVACSCHCCSIAWSCHHRAVTQSCSSFHHDRYDTACTFVLFQGQHLDLVSKVPHYSTAAVVCLN